MSKILFFLIIFISPSLLLAEIKTQQPVDSSCNENLSCEPELNENVDTCPVDCHLSESVSTETIQKGLMGPPIKISNIEISVGISGTTISWETNKLTSSFLVLSGKKGIIKKIYEDKFYTLKHNVILDPLIFKDNYFFKIFSKGIYGDDNYNRTILLEIKQSYQEQFSKDGKKDITKNNKVIFNEVASKMIEVSSKKLENTIVSPELPNKTSIQENYLVVLIETNFNKFKNNIYGFYIIEYIWQIMISLGILWLLYLLRFKK